MLRHEGVCYNFSVGERIPTSMQKAPILSTHEEARDDMSPPTVNQVGLPPLRRLEGEGGSKWALPYNLLINTHHPQSHNVNNHSPQPQPAACDGRPIVSFVSTRGATGRSQVMCWPRAPPHKPSSA